MMRRLLFLALFAPLAVAAQDVPSELQDAYEAWDRGDYVPALRGYLDVLQGPDGTRLLDQIALLTGDLYQVTEITTDGRGVAVSPDGRFATYMYKDGGREMVAAVSLTGSPQIVDRFEGTGARLSRAGTVAHFRIRVTDELARLRSRFASMSRRDPGYSELQAELRWSEAARADLFIRDVQSGREQLVPLGSVLPVDMGWSDSGRTLFVVGSRGRESDRNAIYAIEDGRLDPQPVVAGADYKLSPRAVPGDRFLVYERLASDPLPRVSGTAPRLFGQAIGFGLADHEDNRIINYDGTAPTTSADGSTLAFLESEAGLTFVRVASLAERTPRASTVIQSPFPLENPALSPDGSLAVYQKQVFDDWELYLVPTRGEAVEGRITTEIQHDLMPRFLDRNRLLALKGERRHRRSFIYDLSTGSRTKVLHNNTLRTLVPEYEWHATPDGSKVLIVADRDGNTVSDERGLYVVDLTRKVSAEVVRERIERNIAQETALMARGERMFRPIADEVRSLADRVSVRRIYGYEADLFEFGSKYVTQPGNLMAVEYLTEQLRTIGYDPELEWFEPRGARSANVIARLEGTVDPQLVCTVSSHFDSTERGPGADDDTSGAAALLETARVLFGGNLPITVELVFLTGEEAGLLGSREYVRRAERDGKQVVCALNNDMVGFANNHRLDNTIRYSNPGIRDIQHAAASMFSDLITYDALYYQSTDAQSYNDAWGDIVGGIGSYPILGNPNYHQAGDRLETINHQLVAEVSRTTAATIMLLASSPARLTGLRARADRGGVEVSWDAARESDVVSYRVEYVLSDGTAATATVRAGEPGPPSVMLDDVRVGLEVRVKAVNRRGLEGWDWARLRIGN